MPLSKRKKAFADAIIRRLNNTQAALEAGYAANSATVQGSRLRKDPFVVSYLAKQKNVKGPVKVATAETLTFAEVANVVKEYQDPLAYLMNVINADSDGIDAKLKVDCAKAALPYFHGKIAPKGKKQGEQDLAKGAVATGHYTAMRPPNKNQVQ